VETRAGGGQRDGQLGGRVGMGDGAAHSAAIADLPVTDEAHGLDQKRDGCRRRREFEGRLPRQRSDPQRATLDPDAVEPGHGVDIDQPLGPR
jgi:hypothetical protein